MSINRSTAQPVHGGSSSTRQPPKKVAVWHSDRSVDKVVVQLKECQEQGEQAHEKEDAKLNGALLVAAAEAEHRASVAEWLLTKARAQGMHRPRYLE